MVKIRNEYLKTIIIKEMIKDLEHGITLSDFTKKYGFSEYRIKNYLLPIVTNNGFEIILKSRKKGSVVK